jgi:hypothetical protein
VVSKSFHLLSGMLQISQAYMWLNQVLNIIDLQQMLVQATHPHMSQLWQLPWIDEDNIKFTKGKKKSIKTVVQLLEMKESDRRDMFRALSDNQYNDMMTVAKSVPVVEIVRCEPKVVGEKTIEHGAFVTLFVKLKVAPAGDKLSMEAVNGEKKEKIVEKEDDDVENMDIEVLDDEGGSGKLTKWWESKENPNDAVHAPYFPPVRLLSFSNPLVGQEAWVVGVAWYSSHRTIGCIPAKSHQSHTRFSTNNQTRFPSSQSDWFIPHQRLRKVGCMGWLRHHQGI